MLGRMFKNRRPILRHGIVDLGLERTELPNGLNIDLAVIRHPGASAVVALDAFNRVAMIRQFRFAIGGYLWEIPAGCRDAGENPRRCAERELLEEAGLRAATWHPLGSIVTIPSFCDERIHLYLARDLTAGYAAQDADEVIRVQQIPIEKALRMIGAGRIVDAKTIVALYRDNAILAHEQDSRTLLKRPRSAARASNID
jgi:ADP-ribose pyrophosphatase